MACEHPLLPHLLCPHHLLPSLYRAPLGVILLGLQLVAIDCRWKTGCMGFFPPSFLVLLGHSCSAAVIYFRMLPASHLDFTCLSCGGLCYSRTTQMGALLLWLWIHWWFTGKEMSTIDSSKVTLITVIERFKQHIPTNLYKIWVKHAGKNIRNLILLL